VLAPVTVIHVCMRAVTGWSSKLVVNLCMQHTSQNVSVADAHSFLGNHWQNCMRITKLVASVIM
jgi:hypothetical protein